jgi:uncharacterized protein
MKRRISAVTIHILTFVSLFGLASLTACSQEGTKPFSINESPLPAPTSPVMDYAGVLDAATKQSIEQKIIAFRDSTNPKVEHSLAVARGWKIGSPEQDNPAALLFIAIDDRKYFTHVSKDLEDELPDGLVGQLQRQYLVPAFRQRDYGKGINDTIDAYINTIRNKGNAEVAPPTGTTKKQPVQNKGSVSICGIVICLAVLFIFVLPVLSRFGSSKKRGRGYDDDDWRGGGFGGAASALPWIIGSAIANSGSSSSSSDWGGSSGGGDSWGGFGGGGDFGGGGGGGDW